MNKETTSHAFEDELFFSLRRQRDNWAKVAIGAVAISTFALASLIVILPLKENKPFVIVVDKSTGEAEKIVEVKPATLDQSGAILQAELVSYVTNRETYDVLDTATRIPDVLGRSKDSALRSLENEWTASSAEYPPKLYGKNVRVLVSVKSVSIIPASSKSGKDTAQVRIVKKREEQNQVVAERSYIVTLSYEFAPNINATLKTVWKNPLGFIVDSYRIDAETLQ
jgi:type IV secretion system protein VirB8